MTETDIATIISAIGDMRSDFVAMKTDFEQRFDTVHKEITWIKTEMGEMKTDISDLKTEMGEMKTDISDLKEQNRLMNEDINNLANQHTADMQYIRNFINGLNGYVPKN